MYGQPYQQQNYPVPAQQYGQQPMRGYQNNPYADRLDAMERGTQRGQQQTNVNWIQVNGYDDMRGIMVPPGGTVWAMDINEQIFYVKSADSMGVCTIEAYRYERIQMGSGGGYVTREELERRLAQISGTERSDMYGKPTYQQNNTAIITDSIAAGEYAAAVPAVPAADGWQKSANDD